MLFYTLSALFAFTTLINPIEATAILLVTAYIIYLLTLAQPYADKLATTKNTEVDIYSYLQNTWLGRQSLLLAFWPFFILINASFLYADYRSEGGSYTIASWLTLLVIFTLPVIWWSISVWRCSLNASRLWAIAARFCVVLVYYEYILRAIIAYNYPQIWFNCQQLIIEFGDCL